MLPDRSTLLPEPDLCPASALLERGRADSRDWRVGDCAFLHHHRIACEADYKRARMAAGGIMLHAQIGFRDPAKTADACARVFEATHAAGHPVDRYGICLDWSMGFPRERRAGRMAGTGLILDGPEAFARITAPAPVAPHFGDFVLGFPAALENTRYALAAGATVIGNFGQYFTFRLPGDSDDVAATEATVTALGLIAAQPVEVLVHSNLDDGFAASFTDLGSALGAALIERYLLEELIGVRVTHCFGHHFSNPLKRLAFLHALMRGQGAPGSMIYGNTTAYRGDAAENFAALAGYLMVDIHGQRLAPSGHAVNAVPVSENRRIPEAGEIAAAQRFAIRLLEVAADHPAPVLQEVAAIADALTIAAGRFRDKVLAGLAQLGVDITDAVQLMLALRRLGARRLEREFGAGVAVVPSDMAEELESWARRVVGDWEESTRTRMADYRIRVYIASSDVHEHGKRLLWEVLHQAGVDVIDGGASVDAENMVEQALTASASVMAISTYNGIALTLLRGVRAELSRRGCDMPVIIGGRLNEIPESSNSAMPVDVTDELRALGAVVCHDIRDVASILGAIEQRVTS